ncbi:MAG: hypothetical protein AABX28_00830 [Nanoarchaeota archaeon]
MGVLDQVTQMRNQGISSEEIIRKLQEQGISPKMINDALNQAEIKNAVSEGYNGDYEENAEYEPPSPEQIQSSKYIPKTQEISQQNYYPPQQAQQQNYQEYYPQENYNSEQYSAGGVNTDTVIEISEQVFSEKIEKMQKQVSELSSFKILAESKMDLISERLKKIESVIDRLQAAILEKVGDYGRNIEGVKKEMSMMQDSFGKVVNTLADKAEKPSRKETLEELKTLASEKPKTQKKISKK